MGWLHRFILRILTPVSKLLGEIRVAPKERAINSKHVIKIEELIAPGDILLTFSSGELTNFFIEGEYKHCAMYIGQGEIIEAIGKGVVIREIEYFASSKDKIGVFRPLFCSGVEAVNAVKIAVNQKGKKYDYNFEPNEQAFYCAELIAYAYQMSTNYGSPFVTREILSVQTVLPIDFKLAKSKFQCIAEFP